MSTEWFIDHFRNGRGATAILPYSPRARTGALVALPVSWKELPKIDPKDFDVRTVPALLARRHIDPWAGDEANAATRRGESTRSIADAGAFGPPAAY